MERSYLAYFRFSDLLAISGRNVWGEGSGRMCGLEFRTQRKFERSAAGFGFLGGNLDYLVGNSGVRLWLTGTKGKMNS